MLKTLQTLVKSINKIIKLLKNYQNLRSEPIENAFLLDKKLLEIERHLPENGGNEFKQSLVKWLAEEKQNIEGYKEEFRIKFGQELASLFQREGIKIKGQYPTLRVGFYTLKIDFQFGSVVMYYGPEIEKVKARIPLQAAAVYKTVKNFDSKLRGQKTKAAEIYEILRRAYNRRLTLNNQSFGEKAPIMEVLGEFVLLQQPSKFFNDPQKSHFRECSRVNLSYLMYFLKRSEFFEKNIKLYVATFDATVEKKNALWIPENEEGEGTHYSHISFERAQNT